ncbi:MAG: hypothetical protein HFF52_08035 [Lawsonibacter sp.]|nr:hypothetical protein [Lawsonibacter sp.]
MRRVWLIGALSAALLLGVLSAGAAAAEAERTASEGQAVVLSIEEGSVYLEVQGEMINLYQYGEETASWDVPLDMPITISGSGLPCENTIQIQLWQEAEVHIRLSNVSLQTEDLSAVPFRIDADAGLDEGRVCLTLDGENQIQTQGETAIQLSPGSALVVGGTGSLTIGEVEHPENGPSVGIGSLYETGKLTVEDGTLTVAAREVGIGSLLGGGDGSRVQISGGTVAAAAEGPDGMAIGGISEVMISGGSVTAERIEPAPVDQEGRPVCPVAVPGLERGARVQALALEDAPGFGRPGTVPDSGGLTLYLWERGEESAGAAIIGGELLELNLPASAGAAGTEAEVVRTQVTADTPEGELLVTADGKTVTLPAGGSLCSGEISLTAAEGGAVVLGGSDRDVLTVPGGTSVELASGPTLRLPQGGTVTGNSVAPAEGGTVETGSVCIALPQGGVLRPNGDGTLTLPSGAEVQTGEGELFTAEEGDILDVDSGVVTPYTCTVIFDSQGGSAVKSVQVANGALASRPADPVRDGFIFGGWYTDSACTLPWSFEKDPVTQDVTLYAKWTEETGGEGGEGGSSGGGSGGGAVRYAVVTAETEHGAVEVSRTRAVRNSIVTVTVRPEEGFRLERLTVTDRRGGSVRLTEREENVFAFSMPGGEVRVEAVFLPLPPPPWTNPYQDVTRDAWYYDAVRFVSEEGLMGGYGDGRFGPEDSLSRGQFVQILYNGAGRPEVSGNISFSDVLPGQWYTEAVTWAAAEGIAGGYGDGRFGPEDAITREQLAVMLWRYAGCPAPPNLLLPFHDMDMASGYGLDALRWAVKCGIISGVGGGRLDPGGAAARGQAAQMLKQFWEQDRSSDEKSS